MKVDNELKQSIIDWIDVHKEQMIRDINTLVSIESVSTKSEGEHPFGEGPARVLDAALEMGKDYGFRTQNHQYYAGSILMGNGQRELGILTHLDVVPAGPDWEYEPFHCTLKDGKLIGRGVADDKGPAVAALYAMRCLYELAVPMVHSVRLIMGCSEETGSADMAYYVKHCKIPDFSFVPDAEFPVCNGEKGILSADLVGPQLSDKIGELSGGEVSNAVAAHAKITLKSQSIDQVLQKLGDNKGDLVVSEGPYGVTISAKGIPSHAAFPEGSVNAIYKLCKAVVDCGLVEGDEGTVDLPIGRPDMNRVERGILAEESGGYASVTHYRVIHRFPAELVRLDSSLTVENGFVEGQNEPFTEDEASELLRRGLIYKTDGYTLCELILETGRAHQIRVHMGALGHFVLGDTLYGGVLCKKSTDGLYVPLAKRQLLHAKKLCFEHPVTKEYMEVEAPLASDFEIL